MSHELVDLIAEWGFVRSETTNLLRALTDNQLLFTPEGDAWKPLFWQFACCARTQIVYTRALENGTMDMTLFSSAELPDKTTLNTRHALQDSLILTDEAWHTALATVSDQTHIGWDSGALTPGRHIAKLISHERLHHGQLLSYFTLAGFTLPINFKQNWAL